MHGTDIDTRGFGKAERSVSLVGLGGEGILRTHGQEMKATAVILEAIEQGINYFDCARVYKGSESYYGRIWGDRPSLRQRVFQASKSAERTRLGARNDLEQTLRTMKVEHLDLWQIHDVRTEEDLARISGPDGALEAFVQAREAGKTRFIGVTGHHDPRVLTRAVREWPVDSVMMPINPVEANLTGFMDTTLPEAQARGLAVIAMKVLGAGHYVSPQAGITPEKLIRFALSQDITVAIVGCSNPEHVDLLAQTGRPFTPLSQRVQAEMAHAFKPLARRLAFYRGVI